jgi:hypothetical protein
MKFDTAILIICTTFFATSVSAQTPPQPGPEQPCRAYTEGQGSEAPTEKLQDCRGVLKPPRVGDAEMAVEPEPDGKKPNARY